MGRPRKLEKQAQYLIEITSEAEQHYISLLNQLYQTHSLRQANRKSREIKEMAQSLSVYPGRGRVERLLNYLGKSHRFLIYRLTRRKTIKIIYFVDESTKTVFITDFFPTELDPLRVMR